MRNKPSQDLIRSIRRKKCSLFSISEKFWNIFKVYLQNCWWLGRREHSDTVGEQTQDSEWSPKGANVDWLTLISYLQSPNQKHPQLKVVFNPFGGKIWPVGNKRLHKCLLVPFTANIHSLHWGSINMLDYRELSQDNPGQGSYFVTYRYYRATALPYRGR